MATASLIRIINKCKSSLNLTLLDKGATSFELSVPAGATADLPAGLHVPEANAHEDLEKSRAVVTIEGAPVPCWFWQSGADIYYTLKENWQDSNRMKTNGGAPGKHPLCLKVTVDDGNPWVLADIENQ